MEVLTMRCRAGSASDFDLVGPRKRIMRVFTMVPGYAGVDAAL